MPASGRSSRGSPSAGAATEQPVEESAVALARRLSLRHDLVAAIVGVERGENALAIALGTAAAGHLAALALQSVEIAFHLVDLGLERAAHLRTVRQEGEAAARPAGAAARRRNLIFLRGDRAVVFPDLAGAAAAAQRCELCFELAAQRVHRPRPGRQAAARRRKPPPRQARPCCRYASSLSGPSALPLQNRVPVCRGEVNFALRYARFAKGQESAARQIRRAGRRPAPCARLRPRPAPSC